MQIYVCEETNQHSSALVFLLGQLFSSIPFLFLISISSSLVFYFLIGLRDDFSLLMYFVLNFFMSLLVNEGLMLVIATLWQDVFWCVLTLLCIHVSPLSADNTSRLFYVNIKNAPNQWPILTVNVHRLPFQLVMMLSAGYFRIRNDLPGPVWMYPLSYIAFHTYSIQVCRFMLVVIFCALLKKITSQHTVLLFVSEYY